MATTTTRGRKNIKIDETTKTQVLNKVAGMTAEDLNNQFSSMQLSIQKTFAGLQADVTNRFATCEELDTAIQLKRARLNELHGIESAAIALDDLQAELEAKREQITKDKEDAASEEEARKLEWAQDQKRAEDIWNYETQNKHRDITDKFNQDLLKKQREEAARQEAAAKNWKEREEELLAREAELTDLRKQASEHQAKVEAEVKKANEAVARSIKSEYETKIQLLTKDAEVANKLNKEREQAFQGTITRLEGQCTALHSQVEAAEKRAAEIAKTALDSVSDRRALAAVQQSHEQSQNQPQGKNR